MKARHLIPLRSLFIALSLTLFWGFGWWYWNARYSTTEEHLRRIEQHVQEEITWSQDILQELKRQLTEMPDPHQRVELPARYPLYVYNQGIPVYWSDHRLVPSVHDLLNPDSVFLLDVFDSEYIGVTHRFTQAGQEMFLAALVPLRKDFTVNNTYLQPEANQRIFVSSAIQISDLDGEGTVIHDGNGNPLFTVTLGSGYMAEGLPGSYVLLYIGGLVLLAWAWVLGLLAWQLGRSGRVVWGALTLLVGGMLLRGIMIVLQLPNRIVPLDLFDLRNFYFKGWNPSLGDFLLNIFLVVILAVYLFTFYRKLGVFRKMMKAKGTQSLIIAIGGHAFSFLVLCGLFLLIQVLYRHSGQLSLDITSTIELSRLKLASLVLVVLAASGYFLLSHVLLRLAFRVTKGNPTFQYLAIGIGILLPAILIPMLWSVKLILAGLQLIYALLVRRLNLLRSLTQVRYATFLYFFINLFISAAAMSYGIYYFEKERLVLEKRRFASSLGIENDILGELFLDEAGQDIADDRYISTQLSNPFLSKNSILEKIRRVHLPDHFDRYDVEVYLFNSKGEGWYNTPPGLTYRSLRENYAIDAYATDFEQLYFIQELDANLSERYLRFVEIRRNGFLSGYVVLDLRLKRLLPNSVYPQLFVNQALEQPILPEESSYAIFQDGEVVFHTGTFNYYQDFDLEANLEKLLQDDGMLMNGVHHWADEQAEGNLIVISTPLRPLSRIVANFSMLYLILVFFTLVCIVGYAIRFAWQGQPINFATKIQLYLNLSFFIPLLAVSLTTVSIISSAYREEVTEAYFNRANSLASNLGEELTRYMKNPQEEEAVAATLLQLARHTESDINLYNIRGELITSSQTRMVQNGFISEYINPYALAQIREMQNTQVILDESIGELDYKAVYLGISSYKSGQLIGILSIPFFDAQRELGREVSLVLTSVMNIFTFLFLLFLVASYFLSGVLTFPLRLITQKIRRTSLSERNEPLEWTANDEIGLMVEEYNRMVRNLEASKEALARSEKESAWREMAKQVAHEIKNPLTPMKLTLQHMRRKLSGTGEETEALAKPIDSLLKQVDTLSDIATSFSSFAKMPVPKHEEFDLAEVVRDTVTLHAKEGEVSATVSPGQYRVMGDEKLMGRIVSNLIINGLQSVPSGREPEVEVRLTHENGKVVTEVKDNGAGIAEDIRNKVFVPNFSTKYTGSGLGLAIAKRGIEHAGGRIWFETVDGEGTSFFIEMPLPTVE